MTGYSRKITWFGTSLVLGCLISIFAVVNACEPHWIKHVYDCGEVIQLDDMSLWQVHGVDTGQTKGWKSGENVMFCGEQSTKRMRNVDKAENEQHWIHVESITPAGKYHVPSKNDCLLEKN